MNSMTYKGFSARVDYDADDEIFVGRIVGINDVVGFHADNTADLKTAFHEAVDDYVETCVKAGKEPEKAYSGKLMLRVDPKTHRALSVAAELAGVSLNQFSEQALEKILADSDCIELHEGKVRDVQAGIYSWAKSGSFSKCTAISSSDQVYVGRIISGDSIVNAGRIMKKYYDYQTGKEIYKPVG